MRGRGKFSQVHIVRMTTNQMVHPNFPHCKPFFRPVRVLSESLTGRDSPKKPKSPGHFRSLSLHCTPVHPQLGAIFSNSKVGGDVRQDMFDSLNSYFK